MPTCSLCNDSFPVKIEIKGRVRNLQRRKYCLGCSPFGSGNRKKLGKPKRKQPSRSGNGKYARWQKKARKERKLHLVKMLGGKCNRCGYNKCITALDFHHRDPSQKRFQIGSHGMLRNWEDLVKEAEKCELLCKNCHAEEHTEDFHSGALSADKRPGGLTSIG
jgi:hypothetical protein